MGSRFDLYKTKKVVFFDETASGAAEVQCDEYASLVFDVFGATTFAINVYGSPDGTHFHLLCIIPMTSTVSGPITQITGLGLCGTCVAGLQTVRLVIASMGEQETVSVIGRLSTAPFNYPYCCQTVLQ